MEKTSRRNLLKKGAALCTGIASGYALKPDISDAFCSTKPPCSNNSDNTTKWDHEYTWGHTKLFMEEYHDRTMEILGCLSGEIDHVGELTSRAASVVKNGGTVWQSMNVGHMPAPEQAEKRRGHPGIIRDHNPSIPTVLTGGKAKEEILKGYEELKKGDILFTNHCNKSVKKVRDKGVYVVGVTSNYINNEFRPVGFSHPNQDNLMLKDVSNEILHSYVPYNQGLVQAPEIPEVTICPSSTTGQGTLFWMISAELTNKIVNKNAKNVDKSAKYLDILTERIEKIRDVHMSKIRETAVTMTRRIREGGRWFARSIEHPGLASELSGVASGPMIVNWRDDTKSWDATKDKNVMTIAGISPAFPDEVKLALEKQREGAFVIGTGPASIDGVVPHGRLIDIADVGFNNFSPESGGVIKIKGRKDSICPTSGIVGNIIQQMLCAQWADEMVRRGSIPYYWMGFFQIGGREYDNGVRPFFIIQGF